MSKCPISGIHMIWNITVRPCLHWQSFFGIDSALKKTMIVSEKDMPHFISDIYVVKFIGPRRFACVN